MPAPRTILLLVTLTAVPFMSGSGCFIGYSSGTYHDRDRDEEEDEQVVVVTDGQIVDPAVAGLNYESGSVSGTTGANGEFTYEPGKSLQFSIGDIELGQPLEASPEISVSDLVQGDAQSGEAGVNIRRLIVSLDADPDDEVITIPAQVSAAAVVSNAAVATSIEFLDFGDEDTFASTASQLVAALTRDYPFTAVLVSADDVKQAPTGTP